MTWLQPLPAELAITVANGDVWLSIGLALLLGGACLLFGVWVTRTVGLLEPDAPSGETLGVGLSAGLMVLAAWWAAIWSGGRSSFTPVALGFAIAVALAVVLRARRSDATPIVASELVTGNGATPSSRSFQGRSLILTVLAGGVFIVAVALLYGSTMAPSPRDGVQPIEFNDVAFYSVLGRDLATTGTETTLRPSGFSEIPGLPAQTWYHWGELWLASAVITIFGTAPIGARHFIVLPVILLAAAALTGTIVRRMTGTGSLRAYLLGFLACLFLAPVELIPGPFFSSWAAGMISSIALYGLSAVALLLALYCVAVLDLRTATWPLAGFVGTAIAFILPAHVVVALLALVGVASAWAIQAGPSLKATRRLPIASEIWLRTLVTSAVVLAASALWGLFTDHGRGGAIAPPIVSPFNASWRESVLIMVLGAGAFLAIPVAWILVRRTAPIQAALYVGTVALVVAGAIAWGARLGDFTTFYLFFAGIAVIATPVAAVGVWTVWEHLRATRHLRLATVLVVLCVIQLELGVVKGGIRLNGFGATGHLPVSVTMLRAIQQLPADAKLAYACRPFDESGPGVPSLLGIDTHTARRVVPMCFEAELLSLLIGATPSEAVENLFFKSAPQRTLYPDAKARPSSAAVAAFLKEHGINYIYVDAGHPNSLVDDAMPIAASGDAQVLRVP